VRLTGAACEVAMWTWHWWIFLAALIPCVALFRCIEWLLSYERVAQFEPGADWGSDTSPSLVACLLMGAVWATFVTTILGFEN
jgi:hypothetical protein